ncbi:MAG: hypothetical protein HFE75_01465 [Firmicutes bacterium]|jgi:hypothetical protein|nr:hypothetical protein [Bacillota bacterium]
MKNFAKSDQFTDFEAGVLVGFQLYKNMEMGYKKYTDHDMIGSFVDGSQKKE